MQSRFYFFFADEYRYFLNKERCETGGIRSVASWLDPSPTEPKVNVLAVNPICTKVYYHSRKVGEWFEYDNGRVDDITCKNGWGKRWKLRIMVARHQIRLLVLIVQYSGCLKFIKVVCLASLVFQLGKILRMHVKRVCERTMPWAFYHLILHTYLRKLFFTFGKIESWVYTFRKEIWQYTVWVMALMKSTVIFLRKSRYR